MTLCLQVDFFSILLSLLTFILIGLPVVNVSTHALIRALLRAAAIYQPLAYPPGSVFFFTIDYKKVVRRTWSCTEVREIRVVN